MIETDEKADKEERSDDLKGLENNLKNNSLSENIYKLDGKVPFSTALTIGLQHVLAKIY